MVHSERKMNAAIKLMQIFEAVGSGNITIPGVTPISPADETMASLLLKASEHRSPIKKPTVTRSGRVVKLTDPTTTRTKGI